jgi:hypothetical protein
LQEDTILAHDVFISHSSKDKLTADAICHALENNGLKCWIAPRDVRPGFDYPAEIIYGIENSTLMVLLFSENSNKAPYVYAEIERAFSKGKMIIPYRLSQVEMGRNLELILAGKHWIDAYPGDTVFVNLLDAVTRALGITPAPASKTETDDSSNADASGELEFISRSEDPDVANDRKLAEQGDAYSQYRLGERYQFGNGLEKDYAKAFAWYSKSAEQGNSFGQHSLGYFYASGTGTPRNNEKAIVWYSKAAEQGNSASTNNLAGHYLYGNGVEKDYAKALTLYHEAVEKYGNWFSMNALGRCYENGWGVPQSIEKAREWYEKSAAHDNFAPAVENLKRLKEQNR